MAILKARGGAKGLFFLISHLYSEGGSEANGCAFRHCMCTERMLTDAVGDPVARNIFNKGQRVEI